MKYSLILFAATTALARPHGPDEDDHAAPNPKTVAPTGPAAPKILGPKVKTPAGCNVLFNDIDWPAEADWKKTFPNLVARAKTLAEGVGRPDFKIRAKTYADVQAAVKFAAKHNIRLSVITSGHDFLGRNDAPSGLVIDTSLIQGIKVHESFTPTAKGAEVPPAGAMGKANVITPAAGKQAAVTIGVGVTTQVLNNALFPSKLVTVGAAHGSVAPAGGYGQTAGHSPISTLYGLSVDQFLEFKVVTPDGELRVANKAVNPDLFWALRGGGGGTYGIVVEATMKAHPDIPITLTNFQINTTKENGDGMWESYAELHRNFPDFVDNKGIAGYYYIYPTRYTGIFLHQGKHAGKDKAQAVWEPLLKKLTSYPDLKLTNITYTEYPTFKAYFDARFGAIDKPKDDSKPRVNPWDEHARRSLDKRHGPGEEMSEPVPAAMANLDSRLLGAEHFKNKNLTALLKAAAPFALGAQQSIIQGHLVSGGKAWKPDDDTSVLPAWRNTYVHLIGYNVPGKVSVDSLRTLAPDSGAYANEAFAYNPDWKEAFWGKNYAKLSQIKTKYDPKGLLWVSPGVNADMYEAKEGRVCKRTAKYTLKTAPESDNPNRGRVMKGSIN